MRTKRWNIETCGRYVRELLYTQPMRSDPEQLRARKQKVSDEARRYMNQRGSAQKLAGVLAANFEDGGLMVTLTYDNEHLPHNRAAAIKEVRRYLVLLRKAYRARGADLRYVYATEDKHGDGRLHHHLVISSTGKDYEDIRSLWICGSSVDIKPLQLHDAGDLARYMTKEPRNEGSPVGARTWVPSMNLLRPVSESCLVEDSFAIQPPANAFVLSCETKLNAWGAFTYLEYVLPKDAVPQYVRPSSKRAKK